VKGVYGRIFLTVGVATLLMLAIGTTASFLLVSQRIGRIAGDDAAHAAAAAAAAVDRGGAPALRSWLRADEAAGGERRVLAVDASGADLLGREVPTGLRIRTPAVLADDAGVNSPSLLASRWVPQLRLPDGRRYAIYLVEREPSWWSRAGLRQLPLLLLALAIMASGIVAGILARSFSRPIRELARATRSFATGFEVPQIGARVTGRSDELGALARDFTAMARRLEHLLKAREQLVRDMSHELRTPLARLNVALELLRRKDPGERFAVDMARIQQQADRLDEMIESILGLARLDAMARPPPFQMLDLATFVEECIEDARLEATQRSCAIELHDGEQGALRVYANAAILASALRNVLRNAIRYTPEGARIDVRLQQHAGMACILVQDHGPGVPADALEHVFEPFYRVDDSRGREPGSTGLGLAIVARVMRLHRGAATAVNRPGGGLEVRLSLPIVAEGAVPEEPDYYPGASLSRPVS
jgi:two-component system sensor histidine kinase CpxA